jgi:hypothetical protein
MTSGEFADALEELGLGDLAAAQLLGMSARSVARWRTGEEVPGAVEAAVRAWLTLHRNALPWMPDSMSVLVNDQVQIRRMREHAEILHVLLEEVDREGGPKTHWNVDFERRRATRGAAEVSFYVLANGGFSPSTYHRSDRHPVEADRAEIRDACYCIAQAFAEARQANKALFDIAQDVATNAHIFVRNGPSSLSREETDERVEAITRVAEDLLQLAMTAGDQKVTYQDFEIHLQRLHSLGHFPPNERVSAVADLLVRRRAALSEAQRAEIRRLAAGGEA